MTTWHMGLMLLAARMWNIAVVLRIFGRGVRVVGVRKNVFNDDSQIEEYEYCSQHREKYNECCEGGELKDGKAYGLYFGNIYDGKTWEDMVCWEKNLTRAKAERTRQRGMVIAANHRQKMGI